MKSPDSCVHNQWILPHCAEVSSDILRHNLCYCEVTLVFTNRNNSPHFVLSPSPKCVSIRDSWVWGWQNLAVISLFSPPDVSVPVLTGLLLPEPVTCCIWDVVLVPGFRASVLPPCVAETFYFVRDSVSLSKNRFTSANVFFLLSFPFCFLFVIFSFLSAVMFRMQQKLVELRSSLLI